MTKKADQPSEKVKASGRYRKVEVRTWGDAKFRNLSPMPPCGQGLWLFIITGPHTGPIPGLFRAGRAAMAEELGWELEAFDEAFREAFQQGMVEADFRARVMWVPNAIKHNKPESPNVVKSWAAEFDLIPECDLKWTAFEALKASIHALGEAYAEAFDKTFAKPSPKPSVKPLSKTSRNQEQEQEQEQEQKEGAKAPLPPAPSAPPAEPPAQVLTLIGEEVSDGGMPLCPHRRIIALFAEKLPEMPKPRVEMWAGSQGEENLRNRWKWLLTAKREDGRRYATSVEEGLTWFGAFFDRVAESDFLTGRNGKWTDCSLQWLMQRQKFNNVIDGHYRNDRRAA